MNTAVFEATVGRPGTIKQAYVSGDVVSAKMAYDGSLNDTGHRAGRKMMPVGSLRAMRSAEGDAAQAAVDLILPYIQEGLEAAWDWLVGVSYDAYGDFVRAVALRDAMIPADELGPMTQAERIAACVARGVLPVYCSDSPGARDRIISEFSRRGWKKAEAWWQRYLKGGGQYSHWYGVILRTQDAPASLVSNAQKRASRNIDAYWARTWRFLTDAKSYFKAYNPEASENFDEMMLDAVPVFAAEDGYTDTPGAEDAPGSWAPKKGLSTVAKVAIGVPVAAGAGWGLWKLGVALRWW